VLYAFTLVFDTAARAALPDIIDEDRMMAANSILHGIDTAGDFAYALGGVLVYALGLQAPFYIDAGTFLFSALMVSRMRLPSRPPQPFPGVFSLLARVRGGTTFLLGQPFLKWSTVAFTFAPLAGGALYVLMPLYANSVLGQSALLFGPLTSGAFRFSVLEVCFGVGALLGAGVAARISTRWPRGALFGAGLAGYGGAFALMSIATNFYAAGAVLVAAGACNSLFLVAGLTLVQTLTPSDVRGRVVAARMTIINGSLAIGSALGGTLLLGLPYRAAWLLLGAVVSASSCFVWLRSEVRGQA
jgi:predicted MFS family arabinose efflux permease